MKHDKEDKILFGGFLLLSIIGILISVAMAGGLIYLIIAAADWLQSH